MICKSGELMHSDGAIQSSRVEGRLESFLVKGEVFCLTSNPDSSYLVARKSQNICQQELMLLVALAKLQKMVNWVKIVFSNLHSRL